MRRSRIAALGAAVALLGGRADGAPAKSSPARRRARRPAHTNRVERALRTHHDVWGNGLLEAPDGPSYEAARRLLPPLLYARAPGKKAADRVGRLLRAVRPAARRPRRRLGRAARGRRQPGDRRARRRPAVDGLRRRRRAASATARVSPASGPRASPAGYQPIMTTTYTDASRVRYRQESFAAQTSETGSLVSFIRLDIDARRASAKAVQLRLKPSVRQLRRRARLQPRRDGQAERADVPDQARHEAHGLSRLDQLSGPAHPRRRRRRATTARAAPSSRTGTGGCARARRSPSRSRASTTPTATC